uniref:Candidate secreted effector n=1 Tax=Meloidogyne incognita TaxID=6306 RepID=A0A914KZF5_MELIC
MLGTTTHLISIRDGTPQSTTTWHIWTEFSCSPKDEFALLFVENTLCLRSARLQKTGKHCGGACRPGPGICVVFKCWCHYMVVSFV